MSARADFDHQIDDFQFFRPEKRKFRQKMVLETGFEEFWTILKKSIFLAQNRSGGAVIFPQIWGFFPYWPPIKFPPYFFPTSGDFSPTGPL